MKKIFTMMLLCISTLSQAGYIIAKDSLDNGVLKVSHDSRTDTVRIEHCDNIQDNACELLDVKTSFSVGVSQVYNHIQTASAAVVNIIPAVVGGAIALSPVGWYGAGTIVIEAAGGAALTAAGTYIITIPDTFNVIRLYDYSRIYTDSFIEDDSGIVAFPNEDLADVVDELL